MKDASEKIKKAFFDLLDGNVTYLGNPVHVYDHVPSDKEQGKVTGNTYYYILITDQTSNKLASKDTFIYDYTQLIEVIVGMFGGGSKSPTYNISNQVEDLIKPVRQARLDLGTDFQNTILELESTLQFEEMDGGHIVLRKLLRYRVEVEELI